MKTSVPRFPRPESPASSTSRPPEPDEAAFEYGARCKTAFCQLAHGHLLWRAGGGSHRRWYWFSLFSNLIYTSSFNLPLRWLRLLTPVTYWSKLPGIRALAALMQAE